MWEKLKKLWNNILSTKFFYDMMDDEIFIHEFHDYESYKQLDISEKIIYFNQYSSQSKFWAIIVKLIIGITVGIVSGIISGIITGIILFLITK